MNNKFRTLLITILFALPLALIAQGMTDAQVLEFVRSEAGAGTSQSQIAAKLLQRGVTMEQIRRIRSQYDSQIQQKGMSTAADAAVQRASAVMRQNGDGTTEQALTTARRGSTGEVYNDASETMADAERDVQAESGVSDATGKAVFGRDIFRSGRLSFEPNLNLATPQDYVLGPGDELVVDIYGASQKTLVLTVSPEGTVTIPDYGPVSVIGLTVARAQAKLKSGLGSRYESSDLRLTVGQTRTILVNILGEVSAPGTYHLSAFASVFHALYVAGGPSALGTLRSIKVYRGGRLATVVDMYEYILHGRLAGNIILQDNDVVKVDPYETLVGISGNVKRPMFYEMKRGETLSDLIAYAGGLTGDAYGESVRLLRQTGSAYEVYNVELSRQSSFLLSDGDAVTVDGMLNRYSDVVEVKGAVFRPGQFRLGDGVTSIRTLVSAAGGVTEDAFMSRAVLHRLKSDRSLELISVDLGKVLEGTAPDVVLRNEDILFIPTEADRIRERTLTITGEVMFPGTYEYAEGSTVEDLIVEAGGLTDRASLARVDISRRIVEPNATAKSRDISRTYSLTIRDGLVIDGTEGFRLEPYDVVHVRRSPGFVTARSVTVEGEVNFEGTFTLSTKNQRLTDAVAMAGGVTDDAYVRGATLVRQMNDDERRRAQEVREVVMNTSDERDSLTTSMLDVSATYNVGIDLEKALRNPGGDADIELREGDRLIIPEYNRTVKVSGAVMFPNTVTYVPGKGYRWYVTQAGGFGNRARRHRTFVVYQNGQMAKAKRGEISPGSEIIVPAKTHRRASANSLIPWISVTTSLATIATMVVAITK